MVFIGIGSDDTTSDVSSTIKKILSLRVFSDPTDPNRMWKASVKDIQGEILCVSQFTLLANTTKDKPDFHLAMSTDPARGLYGTFLDMLRDAYVPERVKDGKFGAMMNVSLTNDGPVTFTIDSRRYQYVGDSSGNASANAKGGAKSKKGAAPSSLIESS
ncbi:uncharacterized protein BT62DRAFT_930350 [Guyanagaster necrorhizus]|uniref:D-aminoacyl-tRNA deacylase n=1 Tax=Guyanagaster necrorhizus TaxID=856835 RepID=A0A9P8AUA2_9AGAR|nr:uncharacterized protein BT62DRAFT_930350 [Guyanagaster necrorhizus MCA 3950]KAG7448263.1 hypothetical protein BT62DRAFT_930350 [Guyanagaster necrorhizus MCA 3950]